MFDEYLCSALLGTLQSLAWPCRQEGHPGLTTRVTGLALPLLLSQDTNNTLSPCLAIYLAFVTRSYFEDTLPCLTPQLQVTCTWSGRTCTGFVLVWFTKAMQAQEPFSRGTSPGCQAMFASCFQKSIALKHWWINGHVPPLQYNKQTIMCKGEVAGRPGEIHIFRAGGPRNPSSGKLLLAELYVDVLILRCQVIITPAALLFKVQSPSMGSAHCFSLFLSGNSENQLVWHTGCSLCTCVPVRGKWLANLLGLWNFPTQFLLILPLQ